uniref:NADH-ubiquinone oxidoreductase chain 1 n=1 Tax=Aleuroplatus sp. PB-2004 TaxID=267833 RepID=Q6JCS4_9HEMI|nr:NADH dehydrogenase subunit 1 [Aleuroplatus sp. PB-2004]
MILNMLVLTACVLLSIAFFTLMERKVISFTQNRKGPNKASMVGFLQPMSDAIKLLSKEMNLNFKSNYLLYLLSPCFNLICSLTLWVMLPMKFELTFMSMTTLFMISVMAINTLTMMMMSWASNSNYAFIGMMRTVSQLISYEINLMLIIITMINLTNKLGFNLMQESQKYFPTALLFPAMFIMWLLTVLAETNRTPFDFSEGESELISGFNIEYSSSSFMVLFLSEYSSILFMSAITPMMFTGIGPESVNFYLIYFLVCFFFIWARTTFPRFRYDKLMKLNWTQILPSATFILLVSFTTKMF